MTTNNATNGPYPLSATQGGLGVASPTIHGVLVAQGASAAASTVMGAGKILIGTTASDPAVADLTAGTGISITPASGSITISATGASAFAWTFVAGTSQAMTTGNGYVPNNAGLVTLTLPVTCAIGTVMAVAGMGAGGWKIEQNASQLIHIGDQVSTTGVAGYLSSTDNNDCINLLCIVADTEWVTLSAVGNITYA